MVDQKVFTEHALCAMRGVLEGTKTRRAHLYLRQLGREGGVSAGELRRYT